MYNPALGGRRLAWVFSGALVLLWGGVVLDGWRAGLALPFPLSAGLAGSVLLAAGFAFALRALRQFRSQLELQRWIIDQVSEAVMVVDRGQRIVAVNPAFERITGYPVADALGLTPQSFAVAQHGPAAWPAIWEALATFGHWEGELWARRRDGELYPTQMRIRAVAADGRRPARHVAVFSDVSGRKAQEARIDYLARHDPLTDLPNRLALGHHLDDTLARATRSGEQVAVLVIDLDHFKTVNDSLGHHAGDRLLAEIARRLRGEIDAATCLFRLGGDEFAIVRSGLADADPVVELVDRVVRAIALPFDVGGCALRASPSLGISLYPGDGDDGPTLLRNADTALHFAKSRGRNNHQFFAEPMKAAVNRRLHVESELWQALAENQLELHYQPQVDLLAGRIVAVEALVRWRHPQRGLVAPGEFIPVAEECGLIVPLGHWVLLAACRQARAWRDAGIELGGVAVNISALQFHLPDFAQSVRAVLAETGLPPACLELEITETTLMRDADAAAETMAQLKAMGVMLAIDDFGTGYSSLAYLRRFPVDRLKIDRSFVADIGGERDSSSLVGSIVALGHALGLELVAEGVERPEQAEFLQLLECQRVQGYHFYRPLLADQLEGLDAFCGGPPRGA
ncbi:putative bifunctional diguanylate cyclase/phosphodiesterase [Azonexus sp.]|uniref:putative bifunctional diguanylate cyclase/phosphodiesterase n=1 Tax=Azonexus sp. TaxID=1872668 RepID=UPI0035AF5E67